MKNYKLFLLAGLAWCFAGSMVLKTGITALLDNMISQVFLSGLLIFLIFYKAIFKPLVKKHQKRIMNSDTPLLPWWKFFDRTSYITMAAMMSFGFLLRKSGLLPSIFFAFFYTGLGAALFFCGLRFLLLFLQKGGAVENA